MKHKYVGLQRVPPQDLVVQMRCECGELHYYKVRYNGSEAIEGERETVVTLPSFSSIDGHDVPVYMSVKKRQDDGNE